MNSIVKFYKHHPGIFSFLRLLIALYLFFFSLELMGASLKMFGKGLAENLIQTTTNPMVGLFIGILATSIIQSSSSTTSIVVGLVAGGVLNVPNAIPIIMGANIGTSVTNTLASLTQINRSIEFQRSFSAAVVHDFFNVLAVLVIFPLQYFTNFLGRGATFMGEQFQHIGGLKFLSPVKAITKPVVEIFKDLIGDLPWILLVLALVCLLFSLSQMVKSLKVLVVTKAEAWFDRYLFKTALRAFLVGLLLTTMVQSSSITTSLAVPLAGAGLLTLIQIFPYTLGANIGTTVTAILAALVTGNLSAIIVAFAHLLFNISGIIFWWPLKMVPITLAQKFAWIATRKKIIPILYILVLFFLVPILLISLFR
ncbi:MAG: Na/Pi symporter [Candidatus Aminicenantes bacterium]|nr:MAG: Na/Pi symporter [Candidatus Aminicenantes bacterium]